MRITSRAPVTIAAEIRRQAGLLPHTEVDFEFNGKFVRIVLLGILPATNSGAPYLVAGRIPGS